jgi:hypothetical protein
MVTRLVDNGIADIELTTSESGSLADLGIVILDVFDRNITDKFVEDVA